MENIYFLLFICLILWYFAAMRKIAERARALSKQYCEQQNLQFIAIARTSTAIKFTKKHGLHAKTQYEFEFSGDGESSYKGTLIMIGNKADSFDLPVYKL